MGGNQEWIISAIAFEKTLLLLLGSQVTFIENNAYWNVFPAAICQQLIQKQEIAGRFLHANHGPNLVHIGYSGISVVGKTTVGIIELFECTQKVP